MKKIIKYCGKIAYTAIAVLAVLAVSFGNRVRAGQNGVVNGLGVGYTSVNVSHFTTTNRIATPNNTTFPSAAMAPTAGYQTNAALPQGAATNSYARSKAQDFGRWSNSLHVGNSGDGVDNPELESRITIIPADCASLTFDSIINQSQSDIYSNGNSGTITVNANATAGTALWLRGFEYLGSMADVPIDNPDTLENESIEYLKAHGTSKFEILLVGPFIFGGSNNCPLILPFSLSRGNLEDLIIASDTVAKSNPLLLNCPSNVVVSCGQPVVYSPVTYGACGQVDLTFNPAAGSSFPVGVTPVTVTLADHDGNSTNCTFTVTVLDTSSPTVPTLPVLTGQCSVTVPTPTATNTCGITKKTATGTTSDPLLYTTQGTNIVHWSFNDGNGILSTGNQTVIVKDTIAPVAPVLPTVTGSCSAPVTLTAPTATDNCAGTVTGTTTTVFPITAQGTTAVIWRFSDGNGNSSTATQNVVIAGLTFKGFYAPIGTVSNLCTAPIAANQGKVLPIKFDMLCGTTPITTGTAPIVKIQLWTGCSFVSEPISVAAVYNNDWHYNWDTSAWAKGIYKVIVILPDGTTRYTFVKLN